MQADSQIAIIFLSGYSIDVFFFFFVCSGLVSLTASLSVCQVTLWKESLDGQWACISDVNKGQGAVSSITDGQQNEQ